MPIITPDSLNAQWILIYIIHSPILQVHCICTS